MMGTCQTNRALHLTTNKSPRVQLISCSDLSNMWALVNGSANMCESDKAGFIALIQHAPIPWTCLSLPLRGLEDAWKIFPQFGVEIKMASPTSIHFWLYFPDMKIFLSHLATVRSVSKLGPLNLHPLAYQLEGYLFPVNSSQGQAQKILIRILVWTSFSFCFSSGFGGKSAVHEQPNFLWVHTQEAKRLTCFDYRYSCYFQRGVALFICEHLKYLWAGLHGMERGNY